MNCKKTERLLNQYVDNELPSTKFSLVKSHLESCNNCLQKHEELLKLKNIVKAQMGYTGNPFLWTRISTAISQEPIMSVIGLIPKLLKTWLTIASLLIIVSSSSLLYINALTMAIDKKDSSIENTILEMPDIPENMEKITLNLIIYTSKNMEANYGLF